MTDLDANVACLCETWFTNDKGKFTYTIEESGFEIYHDFRPKRGGGVAITYKKNFFDNKR